MKPSMRSAVAFTMAFVGWITPPDISYGQIKATVREEATCKEIGFAPKTEAFGNCVMELLSRNGGGPAAPSRQPAARQPASTPAGRTPAARERELIERGATPAEAAYMIRHPGSDATTASAALECASRQPTGSAAYQACLNRRPDQVQGQSTANASTLEGECRAIGIRANDPSYARCMQHFAGLRGMAWNAPTSRVSTPAQGVARPTVSAAPTTRNGQTCVSYGFKQGTTPFAQCQMDLDAAQRQAEGQQQQYQLQAQQYQLEVQQYQQQVAGYEAQAAAIKKERDRRKWEMLARVGAGMMSSNSPSFLGGLSDGMAAGAGLPVRPPPVAPPPPIVQNYTIRTPTGAQVYCSYNSAARYMSCR